MTLDPKFIQLATPVLSEFGFSGIKELVTEQLNLMLQAKIDHYEAEDRLYAARFKQPYETVVVSGCQTGSENFELDDALNDWRFARESAALYRDKLHELKYA
ncbi:hypothetical protein JZU51_02205 [bacterium]|nr:hypothetical protein [bacterium]